MFVGAVLVWFGHTVKEYQLQKTLRHWTRQTTMDCNRNNYGKFSNHQNQTHSKTLSKHCVKRRADVGFPISTACLLSSNILVTNNCFEELRVRCTVFLNLKANCKLERLNVTSTVETLIIAFSTWRLEARKKNNSRCKYVGWPDYSISGSNASSRGGCTTWGGVIFDN